MNTFTPFQPEALPNVLPSSAQLLEVLSDDDVALEDVAREVERNPTIAAKLLALANSPWAHPASSITSLRAACTRLGLDIVKSFALAVTMGQSFDPTRCPAFSARQFWLSAVLTSEVAAALANQSGIRPSTARTAGLLHNIGLLALAAQLPDQTDQALRDVSTRAALHAFCGIGYTEVGHTLLAHWAVPEELLEGFTDGPFLDMVEVALSQAKLLMSEEADPADILAEAERVANRLDEARQLAEMLAA